jgi:hypothetical protein
MTCGAETAAGTPCRRHVGRGAERCHVHSGGVVGRHDGLTPEVSARIVQALRLGAHRCVVAEAAGISRTTLWRWLEQGEAEREGRFRELYTAARRAEAEAELRHVALVDRAAQSDWRASAWWLPRRYPERYGQRVLRSGSPEEASTRLAASRAPADDLDISDPIARKHFDELLRRRPADRSR